MSKLARGILWVFAIMVIGKTVISFAVTSFVLNPERRIEAILGAGGVNRIEVQGGEVMEVVGDENQYKLLISSDYRHLFITPTVLAGETIDLSILLVGGIAQDMRFTVGDTVAKTIILQGKAQVLGNFSVNNASSNSKSVLSDSGQELAAMLRAMLEDKVGKYYVTSNRRLLTQDKCKKITQVKTYRYRDLSGAVLEVENISKQQLAINTDSVRDIFQKVIAINIESELLYPGSKARVLLVTKEEEGI